MIIIGILVALAVLFLVLYFIKKNDDEISGGIAIFFGVIAFCCLLVLVISYSQSLSTNAELKAFHSEVFSAYKITAEKTEKMTVGSNHNNESSVILKSEHLQQAPEAANRWKELRDKVEWYNTKLRSKRTYYDKWFFRTWMAEPPKDLPFIKLE